MATLASVEEYLQAINTYVNEINNGQNYEKYTHPLSLKIVLASELINSGNLVRYVNMISDAANQIHDAKSNEQIKMGFYLFNVSVDMLREYLAAHWWQYGGQSSRGAIGTVPKVNKLIVTS